MSTPSQRMFSDGRQLHKIPTDFSPSFSLFHSKEKYCRPVSRAVSGSWRLFTFRQPLVPVQTCCVSYSICSKFTSLYFLTSHFLYLLLLSRSPHKHLSCLSPVLWSACWPLCSPKGNMHERSRKEGNWGMRKESEMGLIRRHRVSCHNSERSAGFFSAVRGQTQSSNWERMSRLQTSAVMHGYSSSESALQNYHLDVTVTYDDG